MTKKQTKTKEEMTRTKFWKSVLSLFLCMTFLWLGFCSWNWAFELAAKTGLTYKAFDAIAFALGFLGLISTCIVNEWTAEKKRQ